MTKSWPAWLAAIAVPVFYLFAYTPYGMDTTDFGYFYAYAWRILQGEVPYRDFFYIKPAFPLYWHAFWLWLTPHNWQILAGKAGFCLSLLAASWLGSLYLNRAFNLSKLILPLPLLATCGFVFGIHSFPHMPWHTADGVLFGAASLFAGIAGWPGLSGLFCALAMLCKQSFALIPFALIAMLWLRFGKFAVLRFSGVCISCLAVWGIWLLYTGAWADFRAMTTGQLDIREALDAGILIYLRQNWLIPLLALLPLLISFLLHKRLLWPLQPAYCYLVVLAIWHIFTVYSQNTWIGFGASWPTLFMLLGLLLIFRPASFLLPIYTDPENRASLSSSVCLAAALLTAWSVAISGGYKIPAFFAAPLLFSFFTFHYRFFGACIKLAWFALATGLLIFGIGYQYPYVFPIRELSRTDIVYDAGQIYPQATGVKVDAEMLARLSELKALRAKYGPNYKTLPGFSFAYYLNGDKPAIASDWLIDWEINGEIDKLYNELVNKNVIVFMERDQLNTEKADAYDRAGYGVPQKVRQLWKIIEETPHFVVFEKP